MKVTKIKILKDTPFDIKGTELSIADFRLKYSYVCSKYTTDEDLIKYLCNPPLILCGIFEFCKPFEYYDTSFCPVEFIYEGIVYKKEMDGYYHKFHPGTPFIKDNSLGIITISEANNIISNAKYIKECLYISNSINRKL